MLRLYAKSDTYCLKLIGSCRILTSSHTGGEVVGDNHRDVRLVVHCIQQSRHSRVSECRVADDCNRGEQSCVGGTLRHSDGCTHIHATRQSLERGQCTEGIATDVAEDAMVGIFLSHLVEGGIYVAMAASLAELRRTCGEVLRLWQDLRSLHTKCGSHRVGSQFSSARQSSSQSAAYGIACSEQSLHALLHHGLSVLHDEQSAALVGEHLYALLG